MADPFANNTPNPFMSASTSLCLFCSTSVPTSKLEEHQKQCLVNNPFVGTATPTPKLDSSILVEQFFKDLGLNSNSPVTSPEKPVDSAINAQNKEPQAQPNDQSDKKSKYKLVDEDLIEQKKPEPKPELPVEKKAIVEPKEDMTACPICNIQFPTPKIEAHVLQCLDNPNPVVKPAVNPIPEKKQEIIIPNPKDAVDSALLKEQEQILLLLKKKREQEEEDQRIALLLSKEKPKEAPKPQNPLAKSTDDEKLAKLLASIDEEDEKKKRETLEARDRELAQSLFKKEKEEEERQRQKKEWENTLKLLKLEAKTELDAEMAKLLKEKEDLLAQLQHAKTVVNVNSNNEVSISLEGVEYPEYWDQQKSDFQSFDVNEYTAEYNKVSTEFLKGMYNCKIVRIERIQNRTLWMWYYLKKQQVAAANKGDPNEVMMFHGSRNDAYDIILKEGLDIRVANLGGAIGAGVYFAYSSATSSGYVSGASKWGVSRMLYCRTTLGSVGPGKHGLRRPPEKSKGRLYDSVGTNVMAVVFDNNQSYPEYVIHYKNK